MNNMRRLFGLAMGVAIVAFALPSVAGNDKKQYSLTMASPSPLTVTATLQSVGNSTISSFGLTVTGAAIVRVDRPASGTATSTASTVSVSNMRPQKTGDPAFVLTIHLGDSGDNISWKAVVWTGAKLNGQTFDLVPGQSTLATPVMSASVGSNGEFSVPNSTNPCLITGQRGVYDKDGTIPVSSLSLFVTNTVPTDSLVHFRWDDQTGDPKAAFDYIVCGPGHLTEGTPATLVAWLNTDGSPASETGPGKFPLFVVAQDCVPPTLPAPEPDSLLPAPYGTLVAAVDEEAGTAVLKVDTTTPVIAHGNAPFDIVIGTERLRVNTCAFTGDPDHDGPYDAECGEGPEGEPEIWYVTRQVGGTSPTDLTVLNVPVMYTPLPLLPSVPEDVACYNSAGTQLAPSSCLPYVPGNQAQMCVVDQQDSPSGHVTEFIDIGDGWGNHP